MALTEKQESDALEAYGWLRSAYRDDEPVWWMARNRENQEVTGSYVPHGRASEFLAAVEHFVRVRWDFYLQLNPTLRRWGTRCNADDITAWCFVPFDLDIVDKSAPADLDAATRGLTELVKSYFGLRHLAPHIVFSGRGQQLWYQIRRRSLRADIGTPLQWPIPADLLVMADVEPLPVVRTVDAPRAVRLVQRYWSDFFSRRLAVPNVTVDLSCVDLPRVMRCPGTVNATSGAIASIIRTGNPENAGLAHAMLQYVPIAVFDPPPEPPPALAGRPWQAYIPHLTRTAADFLTRGASEPGRHKAVSAAVKSLCDAGCPREEALKAVRWGASICVPEMEDLVYLRRTVDREYSLRAT